MMDGDHVDGSKFKMVKWIFQVVFNLLCIEWHGFVHIVYLVF